MLRYCYKRLLVILLLVVLVAAVALAARTTWVLDQPMPPYNWACRKQQTARTKAAGHGLRPWCV